MSNNNTDRTLASKQFHSKILEVLYVQKEDWTLVFSPLKKFAGNNLFIFTVCYKPNIDSLPKYLRHIETETRNCRFLSVRSRSGQILQRGLVDIYFPRQNLRSTTKYNQFCRAGL